MDMNELARKISVNEVGKQVDIAQIKEILRLAAWILVSDLKTQINFLIYGQQVRDEQNKKGSKR